jgi:hypothetical protein
VRKPARQLVRRVCGHRPPDCRPYRRVLGRQLGRCCPGRPACCNHDDRHRDRSRQRRGTLSYHQEADTRLYAGGSNDPTQLQVIGSRARVQDVRVGLRVGLDNASAGGIDGCSSERQILPFLGSDCARPGRHVDGHGSRRRCGRSTWRGFARSPRRMAVVGACAEAEAE